MIIEIKRAKIEPMDVLGKDIPAGQTFTGQIKDYPDRLFIKVYDAIVSLHDTRGGLWTSADDVQVKDYKPVDIKIEVIEQ